MMNNEKVLCTLCGAENEPGTAFCGQCGAKMPGAKKGGAAKAAEKAKPAEAAPAAETPATEAPAETVKPAEAAPVAETPATEAAKPAEAATPETDTQTAENGAAEAAADDGLTGETGEPAPTAGGAKAATKTISPMMLIIGGCALAAIVLIALIASTLSGGSGLYEKRDNVPSLVYNSEGTQAALLGFGKEPWIIEKEEFGNITMTASKNGKGVLVVAEEEYEYIIYYVTDKVQTIIEEEDLYGKVAISDNGNAFVYAYGDDSYECTLVLYRDGKTEVLSENAVLDAPIVLSPNGSSVSWGEDYDDGGYKTMLAYSGKIEELGKTLNVYGLADNAKYVYYQKGDGIYVQKAVNEADRVKISSTAEYTTAVCTFNHDYSQALVSTSNSDGNVRTYLTENGKEAVKLSNDYLRVAYPATYNCITDFKKGFYYAGSYGSFDIYGLDKELSTYKIVSGITNYQLSADGKELLYLQYGDLYKIKTSDKNNEETELYSDVEGMWASPDLKTVYMATDEDELYYLKGEDKAETVSYDYDTYYVSGSDIYYIYDTEVFKATKGKGKLIGEIDFDESDIQNVYMSVNDDGVITITFYDYNYDTTTFISNDGKSFIETEDM
jgi:hypothetical protein